MMTNWKLKQNCQPGDSGTQFCTTFTGIKLKPTALTSSRRVKNFMSSSGLLVEVIADGEIQVENECVFLHKNCVNHK